MVAIAGIANGRKWRCGACIIDVHGMGCGSRGSCDCEGYMLSFRRCDWQFNLWRRRCRRRIWCSSRGARHGIAVRWGRHRRERVGRQLHLSHAVPGVLLVHAEICAARSKNMLQRQERRNKAETVRATIELYTKILKPIKMTFRTDEGLWAWRPGRACSLVISRWVRRRLSRQPRVLSFPPNLLIRCSNTARSLRYFHLTSSCLPNSMWVSTQRRSALSTATLGARCVRRRSSTRQWREQAWAMCRLPHTVT